MTDTPDPNLNMFTNGIRNTIHKTVVQNLEYVASQLDKNIKDLNSKNLPEYTTAMDALKDLEEALIERYIRVYSKECKIR